MSNDKRLIIVTGGSRGIGRATAIRVPALIAFLVSSPARWITGSTLRIGKLITAATFRRLRAAGERTRHACAWRRPRHNPGTR
jgi:NAD(P)-dependent dehydrogenase (short-subunit alcohol dehydrogenase family)